MRQGTGVLVRPGRVGTNRAIVHLGACGLGALALATGLLVSSDVVASQRTTVRTVTGAEALRLLYGQRQYAKVARFGYAELWRDIRRPDVLLLLASSLDRLGKKEDAAVYYTLALRVLAEDPTSNAARSKAVRTLLTKVDGKHEQLKARYMKAAPGKLFTSPEAVDDLWMTQVTSDLHCLHGLYAWKLVGGRKDVSPDWIHNRKGVMHRSGMKYVGEVDGRKGVLYGIPVKAKTSQDADKYHRAILKRIGHPTRITTRNVGKCKFLRIGTKGYGFGYLLKARVAGREVLSQRVGKDKWADLRIDLKDAAGKDEQVTIELVVPEGQRWSEGVWIDYLDFFEN